MKPGKEKKGRMVIIKLKLEESRRKILDNKKELRGKEMWIEGGSDF